MSDVRGDRRTSYRPGPPTAPPRQAYSTHVPSPYGMPPPHPMATYLPKENPNEKTFSLSVQVLIFLFTLAAFLVTILVAGGFIKVNVTGSDCSNLGYTKRLF